MGEAVASTYPQHLRDVSYSEESTLNTLNICIPQAPSNADLWLIYIHGGAWRDPGIDASSFDAAQALLLKNESVQHLAGIASINYRLSPYPSHRTDPSNPADPARNAKHPDHINDVLTAILYLQDRYGFENRYILVGHSCGATLAFQVAMKRYWGQQYESTFASELNVVPPLAIVGVEGIFDIPALLEHYAHEPAYLAFVTAAFGSDKNVWAAASPINGDFNASWSDGRLAYLLHQISDELVDTEQPKSMYNSILTQGWADAAEREVEYQYKTGAKHDEVWQNPTELVQQLGIIIDKVSKLS